MHARGRSLVRAVAGAAFAVVLVAAAMVAQAPQQGEGWVALLQRKMGGTGWSRLPGHGVPTLWHEEPHHVTKASTDGWGRVPEQHRPRVRHAVPKKAKHRMTLEHELPVVYHLPSQLAVSAKVPAADRLAAEKLARNLHFYHKQQVASKRGLGQRVENRLSLAKLSKEAQALPAGYHVLKPGQKLPKGAKIIKAPKLAVGYHVLKPGKELPKGAKIEAHLPKLAMQRGAMRRARMNVPRVGAANHMLDDEEDGDEGAQRGDCECEEGDEECECVEEEPRIANVTIVEPTADERMQIAFADHRASRVERLKARELKTQASKTQSDGVTLIQSGWEKHKEAEEKITAANSKMEEADAMVANANKVLDLANAHKSEALASQMETIAEEFKTAAADKAAKAEEYKAEAETIKAEQEEAEAEEAGGEEERR